MSTDPFDLAENHRLGLYALLQHQPSSTLEGCQGFDAGKRTVIILPGTRVNHEVNPTVLKEFINGMLKQVQRSLKRRGVEANVICAAYGHNDEQSIADHFSDTLSRQHPRQIGAKVPAGIDIHDFVDNVLLPVAGIGPGKHPSVDEACEKLSKISFVGNSYGTGFGPEVVKLLDHKLREEFHYSTADATRMVEELAALQTGIMADLTAKGPAMRTISFAAHTDETTYETMRRIAVEHKRDGLAPAEGSVDELQDVYYRKCGFDPALQHNAILVTPKQTELEPPVEVQGGRGRLIRFAAPQALHTTIRGEQVLISNRTKIDAECDAMNSALTMLGSPIQGINSQPLGAKNLAVEHDIRMTFSPCIENAALSNLVDDTLAALATRPMRNPAQSASASLDALLAAKQTTPTLQVAAGESLAVRIDQRLNQRGD